MSALLFPSVIFKTTKRMNDYNASDMCCGDLNESQLKKIYHLTDVSAKVNPYTLTKTDFSFSDVFTHHALFNQYNKALQSRVCKPSFR